ncbi:CCDC93 N-terminal domain-containing protein [Caenorhabditis elegans]|uniref:CCDC93 N-terminal domain-containing protein n=1 Tax=Caenorhabditis elegans TaxID=6239 RepID=Q93309_CAEEL|nr:Coiled-coil domain-containing protein 93 [Caenorhabditis elegans]CAB01726.2 Coiled-coil domain-containing protein 93 [Caenorhabditis elegans]|eukprot:NP_510333.2 Uncharacterized protein CELE_C31E10.5 [Caenorhabditis elegans]
MQTQNIVKQSLRDCPPTPHDNLVERLVLAGCNLNRVTTHSLQNQIMRGTISALKGFQTNPKAEALKYRNVPSDNAKERMDQCKKVVEILVDVNCPFKVEPHHLIRTDYAMLTPMIIWVLRQTLLYECEHNQHKKFYANFFSKKFASEEKAVADFLRRFREESTDIIKSTWFYQEFKEEILGKKLSGRQILGKYLVTKKLLELDISESDFESEDDDGTLVGSIKKDRLPTAEQLFAEDNSVIKTYHEGLSSTIQSMFIDEELDSLDKRITREARAFYRTRKEHLYIEDQLFTVYSRSEDFDQSLVDCTMQELETTSARVQIFTRMISDDYNRTMGIRDALSPKKNSHGKETNDPIRQKIYEDHGKTLNSFGKILRLSEGMTVRISRAMANTFGTRERNARIDNMEDSPDLCSDYVEFNDDKIVDDIIALSNRISKVVQVIMSIPLPDEYRKEAMSYQHLFMSYVEDVLTKLTDWYWKADLMQYHRIEERKRLEKRRSDMRIKQRQEIKNAQLTRIIFDVNQTIQDVTHELTTQNIVATQLRLDFCEAFARSTTLSALQRAN